MIYRLPYKMINEKIGALHGAITKNFKVEPVCFRGGRWGFGSEASRVIHNLGYQVDTSVTPYIDWTEYDGPDFMDAISSMYRFNPENILEEKRGGCLLEVPATSGFLQKNFKICNSIRKRIQQGTFSRFHLLGVLDLLRILNFRILSPESCSGEDMIKLSKNIIRSGQTFLNMYFHSNSLLPGSNPFVRNEKDLRNLLNSIEVFVRFAKQEGMEFLPLSAAIEFEEERA
jgi:hypothetical protein